MTEERIETRQDEMRYRSQRKLRNYLINKKFQLKYTFMISGLSLILVIILGIPLYKTVSDASDQLAACVLADGAYASDSQVELLKTELTSEKRKTLLVLGGFLLLLLLGLTVSGIYITHKVAGPMYKIEKLLKDVEGSHLVFKGKLRRGDELLELFEAFDDMLGRLRQHRRQEIEALIQEIDEARQSATAAGPAEAVARLDRLKARLVASLE